jgi:hypothetical protein
VETSRKNSLSSLVSEVQVEAPKQQENKEKEKGDYMLNKRVSSKVFTLFGNPSCDLFASRVNRQATSYYSLKNEHDIAGWRGRDAFKFPWSKDQVGSLPYANPPWELIPEVLKKVRKDKVGRLILICPSLTPAIKELAIAPPIVIRHEKDTYIPPRQQEKDHPPGIGIPRWPCSFAVLISGRDSFQYPGKQPALDPDLGRMVFRLKTSDRQDIKALIDSGSQVNVLSSVKAAELGCHLYRGPSVKLRFANGQKTRVRSRTRLSVNRGSYQEEIEFIVADCAQECLASHGSVE